MKPFRSNTENTSVVEESQLAVKFYPKKKENTEQDKSTLNMLSLFSGCGGMDLG